MSLDAISSFFKFLFLIAIEIYTDFIGHHSTQYNISRSMYIHVEFAINAKMNCHNAMAIETSDSFVGCFLFINECLQRIEKMGQDN